MHVIAELFCRRNPYTVKFSKANWVTMTLSLTLDRLVLYTPRKQSLLGVYRNYFDRTSVCPYVSLLQLLLNG